MRFAPDDPEQLVGFGKPLLHSGSSSVPQLIVPDNPRAMIVDLDRYEPRAGDPVLDFARHYCASFLLARVYRPPDKPKVEVAVQVVERWIMARLRHHRFESVQSVDDAIRPLLKNLNERLFNKLPGCRASAFAELDAPPLQPLPAQPYEFGIKVSLAITEKQGLSVGARSFVGNPYGRHTLSGQLEQTSILLQDLPGVSKPKTVLANLGYRGVDADRAPVQLIHRCKRNTLSSAKRRWLNRRQAIEPIIAHEKQDHGMQRCWFKGQTGTSLHALLCAVGYSLR